MWVGENEGKGLKVKVVELKFLSGSFDVIFQLYCPPPSLMKKITQTKTLQFTYSKIIHSFLCIPYSEIIVFSKQRFQNNWIWTIFILLLMQLFKKKKKVSKLLSFSFHFSNLTHIFFTAFPNPKTYFLFYIKNFIQLFWNNLNFFFAKRRALQMDQV